MKKFILSSLLVISASVYAACPDLYPKQVKIPVLPNTVELCNTFYVSVFDTNNKGVIFVSEHLTDHDSLGTAHRVNAFKSDPRLGENGPDVRDYATAYYDRGHMAPAADASTSIEMNETFLLSNMTPQEPTLNRISWKQLEENTRKKFTKITGDMYVLNIAVYHPGSKRIGSGIPVPAGYWKIIISKDSAEFFYADNIPHAVVKQVSAVDIPTLIKNAGNF